MSSLRGTVAAVALLASALAAQSVTGGKQPVLPKPFSSPTVANPSHVVQAPSGFLPQAPAGFHVSVFADQVPGARWLAVAPNGDIFVAESDAAKVEVLHDPQHTGKAVSRTVFADHLREPFGIAFHNDYVYIGDTNELLRFKYDPKTSKRIGEAEHLLTVPTGGHTTRTVVFGKDGALYFSVGSHSNIDIESNPIRAAISVCSDDRCVHHHIYGAGLRNPVGVAINPQTGAIWTTVNERDMLGDDLPPDYFTSVKKGGFYGWPYSYIGKHVDPRVKPQRPDLVAKAIVPDVLLGAHRAPLQATFYEGSQFPDSYKNGAFIAEHGSWNRSHLAGYQVAFVPFANGKPSGPPQVFLSGFAPDPSKTEVWGRPVGVAVAPDGSLLVSDDGGNIIWRVSH